MGLLSSGDANSIVNEFDGSSTIEPSNFYARPGKIQDPNILEESASAFLVENEIASTLADPTLNIDNTPDPDFDWTGNLVGTEYESHMEYFSGAFNQKYMDALKVRFNREKKAREVLDAGGASAMAWSFLAAFLSPTNVIPGALAVKGARAGYSTARSARNLALSGSAAVTAQEYALHQSQGLRTAEESLISIAMGTAFAGVIGGGLAKMANRGIKSNWSKIFDQAIRQSEEFRVKYDNAKPEERVALLGEAKELASEFRLSEVKAAAKLDADLRAKLEADDWEADVDALYKRAFDVNRANNLSAKADDMPLVEELGIMGRAAHKYTEATKWLNPSLRNAHNPSRHARLMAANLFESPLRLEMNAYRDSPTAIETQWKQWIDGRLADALRKIGTAKGGVYDEMLKAGIPMKRREFRELVGRALRDNDGIDPDTGQPMLGYNEHIVKAAGIARQDIFETLREELNKIGYELSDKSSKTAMSYFTRVYNVPETMRQEPWFKDQKGPVWDWVERALNHEIDRSARKLDKRINNLQAQIDDLTFRKLRRQADLEYRETGEAGNLHRELNDIDREIADLEAARERIFSGDDDVAGVGPDPAGAPGKTEIEPRSEQTSDKVEEVNFERDIAPPGLWENGITKSDNPEVQAEIDKYGPIGSREWAKNKAAEARRLQKSKQVVDGEIAVREADIDKLFDDARRILPEGTRLELVDGDIDGKAAASFSEKLALVRIAKNANDKGMQLRHEAVHALRSRFTDDEWSVLSDAGRKANLADEARYRAAYEGRANIEELIDEERVAKLIEYAYRGGDISHLDPQARTIIERILQAIKALAETLQRDNFKSLSKIIDDLERGEIARRQGPGHSPDRNARVRKADDTQFNLKEDYEHETGLSRDRYAELLKRNPFKAMLFHTLDDGERWLDPAGLIAKRNEIMAELQDHFDDIRHDLFAKRATEALGDVKASDFLDEYERVITGRGALTDDLQRFADDIDRKVTTEFEELKSAVLSGRINEIDADINSAYGGLLKDLERVGRVEEFLQSLPLGVIERNAEGGVLSARSINPYGRVDFTPVRRHEALAGERLHQIDLGDGAATMNVHRGAAGLADEQGVDEVLELFIRVKGNEADAPDIYLALSREITDDVELVHGQYVDFEVGTKQGERLLYDFDRDVIFDEIAEELNALGYFKDGDDVSYFGFSPDGVFGDGLEVLGPGYRQDFIKIWDSYYSVLGSHKYISQLADSPETQGLKQAMDAAGLVDFLLRKKPQDLFGFLAARRSLTSQQTDELFGGFLEPLKQDVESMKRIASAEHSTKIDDDTQYSLSDKTKTPEFKKWFGDSKVVDGNGDALVVYHGTGNTTDLDAFNPSLTGLGHDQLGSGFYFTNTPETASGYAWATVSGQPKLGGDGSPGVLPVYLSIQKPIELTSAHSTINTIHLTTEQAYSILKRSPDIYNIDETPLWDWIDLSGSAVDDDMIREVAENYAGPKLIDIENDFFRGSSHDYRKAVFDNLGYDGVVQKFDDGETHYVAWFPEQIKSVNNRGAFDPEDPRILYNLDDNLTPEAIDEKLARLQERKKQIEEALDKIESGQSFPLGVMPEDVKNMVKAARSADKAKMPETLSEFLSRSGGLMDQGGELAAMGFTPKTHPKLVRSIEDFIGANMVGGVPKSAKNGMSLDRAGELAFEEGFYSQRPSVQDLLVDLADDLGGYEPHVRQREMPELAAYYDQIAVERELDYMGIDPKNKNFRYDQNARQDDIVRAVYRALNKQDEARIKRLEEKKQKLENDRNHLPSKDDIDHKDQVDEIVNSIFNKITGRDYGEDYAPFDNVIDFGFLKGRTFGIDDKIIEHLLIDDVEMVLRKYARNVAGQVLMNQRFGSLHLKPHFTKIEEDYNLLRAEVHANKDLSAEEKAKRIQRLKKQEDQTIKDFKFGRDKILGRYKHDVEAGNLGRAVDAAMAFQFMISLGGVLLTSLSDAWRLSQIHGFRETFGNHLPKLIAGNKGMKVSRELARKWAGIAEIIHNSRLHELSGLRDPLEQMSPAEVAVQKMTDRFSKLTGLPYWNQFFKEFAAVMTMDRIIGNMVKGLDNLPPKEAALMRSLNLGDISTQAESLLKSGAIEQIEGVWVLHPDKMHANVANLIFAAVKREIDTAIVTPGLGDKPVFSHHPLGRMATQFRNFGMGSNQRMLARGMQDEAGRFWGSLAGMVTTGMFIYMLKQLEAGRDFDDNPRTLLIEGLDRSGMFFLFFELNNMVEKLRGPGLYTLAGAKQPASRFASRNMFAGFFPLAGTAGDVANVTSQGLSYLNPATETDWTPADIKSIRRLTPYASLPYWRALADNYVVPHFQEAVQ